MPAFNTRRRGGRHISLILIPTRPTRAASLRPRAATRRPTPTATSPSIPGDRLPGVPVHQGKLGLTCHVTDQWTVGAVLIAQSGQYLFGDEANLTPQLPGFVTLNLSTSYQLTPHIQFFGSVENVTDAQILHVSARSRRPPRCIWRRRRMRPILGPTARRHRSAVWRPAHDVLTRCRATGTPSPALRERSERGALRVRVVPRGTHPHPRRCAPRPLPRRAGEVRTTSLLVIGLFLSSSRFSAAKCHSHDGRPP